LKKLVIATRGSKLALWQSNHIKAELNKHYPDTEIELMVIKTKGDKILDTPLALIGGKGLFTKEIEDVMLEGKAHLAVHSLKDVPTKSEEGLRLNAITKREDSRDAMLSEKYSSIDELPKGAVVGTTSLRRRMQLLAHRDDLTIKDLRGNVDTRINKLKNGEFDAIILASAGLNRLGLNDAVKYVTPIDKELMIPAMGQAALGIETPDNEEMAKIVSVLNDDTSNIETTIERDFIDALDGGCQVPIGINAELNGDSIDISAILGYPDGTNMLTKKVTINKSEYKQIGDKLAQEMIKDGAKEILAEAEKRAFK
jgi:hydroxymethylbilane synthase